YLSFQTELASVLRFVLYDQDQLYLSDNLEKYLRGQRESPIQDVLNTPQFQLRKLQKQLRQERDMRDELERELANKTQVIQLQHRVQRMMRDSAEHNQQPKEMEELLNKNEALVQRLHEVLKQCQDLKTNKNQMEKKIDDLTEENGVLSVQMREVASHLSSAQAGLERLTAEQQSSQAEWESKRALLEFELSQALSQKHVFVSLLQWERLTQEIADLTQKLSQHQERILQLQKEKDQMQILHNEEKAKFEAANTHLEALISELNNTLSVQQNERELLEQKSREQQAMLKTQIEALSADIASLTETVQQRELDVLSLRQQVDEERRRGKELTEVMAKQEQVASETIQALSERVDHLGNALKVKEVEMLSEREEWNRHRLELSRQQEVFKEAHETASRERDAISAEYHKFCQEKQEVDCKLNQQIMLLEEQRRVDQSFSLQLRRDKQELEEKVASLEAALGELGGKFQNLELESEMQRMDHLELVDSLKVKLQEADETLQKYEGKLADHCRIVEEHIALQNKLTASETSVKELGDELEVERKKYEEAIAANLQKQSQMAEEIGELERKTETMSVEMEHLRRELGKAQEEKLYSEACLVKLTEEGREVANALSAARDQAFLTIKEREAEIVKLSSEVQLLKTTVMSKDDEISSLLQNIKAGEEKISVSQDLLERKIEEHKQSVSALELELSDVNKLLAEKTLAVEMLENDILSLQGQFSFEHERTVSLEQSLKLSESALQDYKRKQDALRKDVVSSKEVIRNLKENLGEVRQEWETFRVHTAEINDNLHVELEKMVGQLQVKMQEERTLASQKESELDLLRLELKEKDDLRIQASEAYESRCKLLEDRICQLNDKLVEVSTLASAKESELISLHKEVEEKENLRVRAIEKEEVQHKEMESRISQLQAQVTELSSLASKKDSELDSLHKEMKEKDNLRVKEMEMEETLRKELGERIAQFQTMMMESSAFASKKESELEFLRKVVEMEEVQRKDLDNKITQLQTQVTDLSTLASKRESELESLHKEMKEKDNRRVKEMEMEEVQRKELESRIIQLQTNTMESSDLAAERKSELDSLHEAMEVEKFQRKELENRIAQLQTQATESSTLASERESELESLHKEMKEKDNLRMKSELECLRNGVKERDLMLDAQRIQLEGTINQLKEELHASTSLASLREQIIEKLNEDLRRLDVVHHESMERDAARLRAVAAEELNRKELEETIAKLKQNIFHMTTEREQAEERHLQQVKLLKLENATLLNSKETLLKEQELCKQAEASMVRKLEIAKQELATLLPLRDSVAEKDQLYSELKQQLQIKTEALEHYKLQVEKAKTHYNGKKQQVLEAQEKVQTLEKALESNEHEVKTLKGQMKLLQTSLDQAKLSEKNLVLKVNSLQAQVRPRRVQIYVDYADRQLREQIKLHGTEETLNREPALHPASDKQQESNKQEDLSRDSLDFTLDDSLNATRPSGREESSTPLVRSSERLAAKRRALAGESLETLYFTPMSDREHTQRKLESSITSLGELALDSARKGHSARRRTKQVINITMTKVKSDADSENESFYSLQSAQSVPNLTSQRGRFVSMEMFEEPLSGDQLRNLPGYRRSTAHSTASHRSEFPNYNSSTFGVGAENEPDLTDDWMRIAELQARNKACLPHLKSSYPLESRPSIGIPSFVVTDEDLRTGDPNETIRRASMLPGQIATAVTSHRATLAKKTASCFPRPMTPKDRNDRRFASQNNQNRPPNTPVSSRFAHSRRRQSMMFSIENTPKKNGKSSILQRGINKMRGSTRKSPSSVSRVARSGKSPSVDSAKPQRRSPRIAVGKSPKITASAKKVRKVY
uniref:Nuclear mitotic apparatus protein 1 n=1 Tax=Scleropages formosus TaxID=113540 RepID=A0A8C9TLF1_SCLFO